MIGKEWEIVQRIYVDDLSERYVNGIKIVTFGSAKLRYLEFVLWNYTEDWVIDENAIVQAYGFEMKLIFGPHDRALVEDDLVLKCHSATLSVHQLVENADEWMVLHYCFGFSNNSSSEQLQSQDLPDQVTFFFDQGTKYFSKC